MPDVLALVIVIVALVAWLIAEWRAPRSLRVALGILCLTLFISAWMFSRQSTAHHDAWNAQTVRMIGAALDRGDIETAKQAIDVYEAEHKWHPAIVTLDFLNKHRQR